MACRSSAQARRFLGPLPVSTPGGNFPARSGSLPADWEDWGRAIRAVVRRGDAGSPAARDVTPVAFARPAPADWRTWDLARDMVDFFPPLRAVVLRALLRFLRTDPPPSLAWRPS